MKNFSGDLGNLSLLFVLCLLFLPGLSSLLYIYHPSFSPSIQNTKQNINCVARMPLVPQTLQLSSLLYLFLSSSLSFLLTNAQEETRESFLEKNAAIGISSVLSVLHPWPYTCQMPKPLGEYIF
jgi:hypothetical protein